MVLLALQSILQLSLERPAAAWLISPWACSRDAGIKAVQDAAYATYVQEVNGDSLQIMLNHVYRHGKPDALPYDDPRAYPLSAEACGLPPTFFSWDLDESIAVDSERLIAKLKSGGVVVASSSTRFGLHVLPIFDLPEAAYEMAAARIWLSKYI